MSVQNKEWEIGPSDLPEFCYKPTLVLGCGNALFGDDGFGCAVIDFFEHNYDEPESVCLLDAGTGVRKLLFTLCLSPIRPQQILIIDAIDAGRTPGEVFEINPSEIPMAKLDDFSLHQLPTSNLLRELQETCGVKVRVLACQTGALPDQVYAGLTEAVSRAVPIATEWLRKEYFALVSDIGTRHNVSDSNSDSGYMEIEEAGHLTRSEHAGRPHRT